MARFRYRTNVLLGPWRSAPELALADAVRAKQARPAECGDCTVWVVPGSIEEDPSGEADAS